MTQDKQNQTKMPKVASMKNSPGTFCLIHLRMAVILALALGSCLQLSGQSCTSAVCNAATPNRSDVLAALPSSSTTQSVVTVNIPSGTATWSSELSYTVPAAVSSLTIQGATTVNCTGTAGTSGYVCTATNNTVIVDGIATGGSSVMKFYLGNNASLFFRITGISLTGAGTGGKYNGEIQIASGASQNVRIDHNSFSDASYANSTKFFLTNAAIAGVADHNAVYMQHFWQNDNGFVVQGPYNDGTATGDGDGTWANPTLWGSSHTFYVESNYVQGGYLDDCAIAGAIALRYNYYDSPGALLQTHGTKSSAFGRACRLAEAYGNYVTNTNGTSGDAFFGQKGSPAMIWGNTVGPHGGSSWFFDGCTDRSCGSTTETNIPNGWWYCGTSAPGNPGGTSPYDGNSSTSTGYPCLDGIGRGQNQSPLNGQWFPNENLISTGSPGWPQQYLEPTYAFANNYGTLGNAFNVHDTSSTNNRDYFFDCGSLNSSCSSFNGTKGTGSGLLSARPATCTAGPGGTYGASPTGSYGVGYWATDTNTFYVCTSTNTWTAVYTPYVYPHPLVSGGTTYSLTVNSTNGTVTGTLCATSGAITAGQTIGPCNASANTGYTFTGWSGTGSASGVSGTSAVSFALNADSTLTATMTVNSYVLTANTAGSGSGTNVCTPSGSINFGTSVSCTASATSGTFTGWSGGICTGTTNPCVFTMPASAATVTANFANAVANPTFSPVAGTYGPAQSVAVSSTTSGATFCYTTDGSTPTTNGGGTCVHGFMYASPISVSTSQTIKAIGTKSGYTDSSVQSAAYVINGSVASVAFSPAGGAYASTQTVTLATATGSATICYTTDGSTPTTDGNGACTGSTSTYSTPLSVATTQTVTAIATKSGFSDSGITSATYTINGTLPTPTFAPAGGSYGGTQSVTISATGGSSVVMINAMQETANANDTIGSSVHRNTYTNCIATCASGSPAPSPYGTLWCTSAIKSSSTIGSVKCPAYASNGVVSSSISGTGTSALDNGNGAGGSDSPTSVTATYAGASTGGCGAHGPSSSGYVSGLTFPDPGANALLTMGIATGSPGNTSILTVSKYNSNGDAGRYVAQRDCVNVSSITKGGQHYESDYNYNTTGGTYLGFGKDFDYPNKHFRAAPQGSSWITEELCPVLGGSCITTYNWPLADYLVIESYEHWDAGCTYSSGSACAYYDAIGIQPYSGGSPAGSMVYYTVRNASTHATISFIPINKTSWTHPQYGIQHQWDIDASSTSLQANIDYSTAVAYAPVTGSATICYTTDGTTPTGDGAGTCTHGTTYTGAISIPSTTTVKAIATQSGYLDSAVGSATYTINGSAATPTFSPVAGTYTSTQSVTLSSATAGATICYTTDGTTPTADGAGTCTHGTTYSTAVPVAVSLTIQAIASEAGYTDSSVGSAAYVITAPNAPRISGTVTLKGVSQIQ